MAGYLYKIKFIDELLKLSAFCYICKTNLHPIPFSFQNPSIWEIVSDHWSSHMTGKKNVLLCVNSLVTRNDPCNFPDERILKWKMVWNAILP